MKEISVVIDAGHGDYDWGCKANGTYNKGHNGILEKDINLEIATRVGWYLAQHDISYVLTRWGDRYVELGERADFANKVGCSLFLSIHCNYSGDSRIKGMEVWHYNESEIGNVYSNVFCHDLASLKYTSNRGVKSQEKNFYVLRNTIMPAVLIELGFLSNPEDCLKLNDPNMQMIIAEKLKESVKTLNLNHKTL